MYFKITNANENHFGYQYADGLNILDKQFEKEGSCVPGGLYFSDEKNILNFMDYGIFLREIELPHEDSDFRMVQDPLQHVRKWRANKIILGKKYHLSDIRTYHLLQSLGVDLQNFKYEIFTWAAVKGHIQLVNMAFSMGINDMIRIDRAIMLAATNGHLEVVKFLIAAGADPKNHQSLINASQNGHLDVVKFLVEQGANVTARDDAAVRYAAFDGHLEIIKFLIANGADFQAADNYAIDHALASGHMETVHYLYSLGARVTLDNFYYYYNIFGCNRIDAAKYLVEQGFDVQISDDLPVKYAVDCGHLEMVKFLIEKGADYSEAFLRACESNQLEIVKYFVSLGLDILSFYDDGIKYASRHNNHNIVDYLTELRNSIAKTE